MYYIASKKEFAMLKNHNKHLYCRLELLDKDLNVIDNLEGLTIDGIAGNEVWRKIDILMLNKVIEDD